MDWTSVTFDWNRARAFLVTAEEGSLSAAARALGLAQPTLGRQVEAFQDELGVVLFERKGRGLELTPAGHSLITHARAMGEAAGRLSLAAHAENDDMEGLVKIAASDSYAGHLLPPILKALRAREPGIQIELVVSNTASDLIRREADIAIRNFRPTEADLIGRKIRDARARLYATPNFLAELGNPTTPEGFGEASFIGIDTTGLLPRALQGMGMPVTEENFTIHTQNFLVMWSLVKEGMGIGVLDDRIGDNDPDVQRILPDLPPMEFPVWLVAHRDILRNRRLRFVWDFLADALK